MNLTREQTIEALEHCIHSDQGSGTECSECVLSGSKSGNCCAQLRVEALRWIKENEPAPSVNDTSSETTSHVKNTTVSERCQEVIDTASCTGEIIAGLKFMYPNAIVRGTMTNEDRCCVDFKHGGKNYSLYLQHDTYADNQEADNGDQN